MKALKTAKDQQKKIKNQRNRASFLGNIKFFKVKFDAKIVSFVGCGNTYLRYVIIEMLS